MKTLLSKLREKSTWLGIATILTAFGVPLPPEIANVVGELVQAAAGVALVAITPKK
jgi:predicted permease